jgi:hypothetical protein
MKNTKNIEKMTVEELLEELIAPARQVRANQQELTHVQIEVAQLKALFIGLKSEFSALVASSKKLLQKP